MNRENLSISARLIRKGFGSIEIVTIKHLPTGITVEHQGERSQYLNKAKAIEKLKELLNAANKPEDEERCDD